MKRAIITGVRRIGYWIAKRLLEDNYQVGIIYKTKSDSVKSLESEFGKNVIAIQADLDSLESAKESTDQLLQALGGVDCLLHLASPYVPTPFGNVSESDLMGHMNPIALSFFLMVQSCLPYMLKNEGPIKARIIAFGDWATNTTPYRGFSAYFLAKGALHTCVKVLARELAPHILVNAIALGPVLKPEHFSQELWESYILKTPLKREVSIEDILELSLFLLRVNSMTGEIINLDSGRHVCGECE
ncbi:MAG: SDR family oxidoreductase [Aquificaceae bacterium]